jgi:Coenzyme PQQ synthesis protein D (PqqD)
MSDDVKHGHEHADPSGNGSGHGTPLTQPSFTVHPGYRPRKCADVLELDMGDGLILYNHDGDLVHHLNPSAGIVWQICDGTATVAELAADISSEYGLEVERAQTEVAGVIAEFDALGLVEDDRRIELRSQDDK